MSTRFFSRRVAADRSLFRAKTGPRGRRRLQMESLEKRAMLATNVFNVDGSWTSNSQAGTITGTLSVDTDTGRLSGLSLSRVGGNMSTTSYGLDAISAQGSTATSGYSLTTAARGSYELRMSWGVPSGSLATYTGGSVSSFSFTSPTLGTFISGRSATITNRNDDPTDIVLSSASIAENQPSGTVVGTVSTSDPDVGDAFTYSLVAGTGSTDNALFAILGNQLTTAASLDYETKSSYSIRVRSTDQGGLFTEKAFTIGVTDVAEPPSVAIANPVTSLAENTVTTTRVKVADLTVSAGDGSSIAAPGGFIQPAGMTAASAPTAYFDVATGVLQIDPAGRDLSVFNFTYNTTVANVIDSTSGPFVYGWGSGNPNSVSTGSAVHTLPSGTWSLVTSSPARLAGAVSLTRTGSLATTGSYAASTSGWLNRPWSFGRVVTPGSLTLADARQNFIALNTTTDVGYGVGRGLFQYTIDGVVGSFYGSVVVTSSAVANATPVLSGADATSFEVDGSSLYLKAGVSLDFETKPTYAVTISVPRGNTVPFTLSVTNVNEAPTNVQLSSTSIAENLPAGTTVGTFSSADADAGNTFSYTLVSGTGDDDNASFSISGNLLQTASRFDYESKPTYSIRIRTTDQDGLSAEKILTIGVANVSDQVIGFSLHGDRSSYFESVSGGQIVTEDWGGGNTVKYWSPGPYSYSSATISYTIPIPREALAANLIAHVDTPHPFGGMASLRVRPSNGAWRTLASTTSQYNGTNSAGYSPFDVTNLIGGATSLTVEATLRAGIQTNGAQFLRSASWDTALPLQLTLTYPNAAPTDIVLSVASVAENVEASSLVGTISTTDPDSGDTFTYSLVSGEGSTDNGQFTIVGSQLETAATLDYEAKSSYSIRVRSTDQSGLYVERSFTILVSDVNEAPTAVSLWNVTRTVNENTSTASRIKVADTSVTDDALGTILLSLSGVDAGSFEVDGSSLYLKPGVSLDFETKASYQVNVLASDSMLVSATPVSTSYTLLVADVNEAPTTISLSATVVAENLLAGTVIGTFSTTDPDVGDTFTYSLVSGTGSTDNAQFTIAGNQLRTAASFNYEAKGSYSIRVRSMDAGGLSTERAFTISVADVQELPVIEGIGNVTVAKDSGQATVSLSGIRAGDSLLPVRVTAVSSDPSLVPSPTVDYASRTFSTAATISTGVQRTHGVAVGDFNGDGKMDIAANSATNGILRVTYGDGLGGFAAPITVTVGVEPYFVIADDFNNDGIDDVAVSNFESNLLTVRLGSRSGTFEAERSFASGNGTWWPDWTGVWYLATGDFNADGRRDIVSCNIRHDFVAIYLGDGAGGFGSPIKAGVWGATPTTGAQDGPYGVVVKDFNRDGKDDVAVAVMGDNTVRVLLGNGSGGLAVSSAVVVGPSPRGLTAGDFDNDGLIDLAATNTGDGTVTIVRGDGAGGFVAGSTFTGGVGTIELAAADLDRDGNVDLVTSSSQGQVFRLRGRGNGTFGTPESFVLGPPNQQQTFSVIKDINGDRFPDVASIGEVWNQIPGDIDVLLSQPVTTGSLSFAPVAGKSGTATVTVTVEDGGPDGNLATVSDNNSVVRTFTVTVTDPNSAPSGTGVPWTLATGGNGHSYELVQNSVTWTAAKAAAEARGGYLATITSAAEQAFVESLSVSSGVWLGGYQDRSSPAYSEPHGGWRWVTNEPWSYSNWAFGEPNNLGGEDWLEMSYHFGKKWNDLPTASTQGFIIEFEGTSKAPTDIAMSPSAVSEISSLGTVVGTLSTTDPDAVDTFTYSLVSGTGDSDNTAFTIIGGELRTATIFDYETKSSYSIRVRSTDAGGLSTEKAFAIAVTNVNEVPAGIALTNVSIAENQALGTTVGTLSTSDPDAGDTFTYSLVSGTGAADNSSFSIVGNQLKTTASFDYESKSFYSIRVRSTDAGGLSTERAFTIAVTNVIETSAISTTYPLQSSPIGTWAYSTLRGTSSNINYYPTSPAVFADAGFQGYATHNPPSASPSAVGWFTQPVSNVAIGYYIFTTYATSSTDQSIDFVSGGNDGHAVFVDDAFVVGGGFGVNAYGSIAFTAGVSRKITVAGYNAMGDSHVGFVTTNAQRTSETAIENVPGIRISAVPSRQPTAISLSSSDVAENMAAGTVIGSFSTSDPDSGDTFTYSLVSGAGAADNSSFSIVGNQLKTTASFDYESKSSYSIRVRSTDQAGLYTEQIVAIAVSDVAEVALSNVVASIAENTSTAARIKVADVAFATPPSSVVTPQDSVYLYGNYGTVATSVFSATVGYVNGIQNNTLIAQGFTTGAGQWEIKQVDVALAASGIVAANPTIYLVDDNAGVPGRILSEYVITNGPVTNSKQTFVFTGSYVASPSTNYWLVVGDTNSQSQQSSLEWYLEDTGANPSQRNSSGFSYLGTKVQNFIGANWTDTHSGLSIRVTSATALSVGAVLSGTDAASFEIDGNALYLKAGAALDYETKTTYAVTVSVPQGNSVPYTLTVTNVNEAPTNVALSASTVAENQASGTTVGTLSTTDPDSGNTSNYSLVSGIGSADNAQFTIVGSQLKTAASFDYESKSSYSIRVRTTDQSGLHVEKVLTIAVTDVSEPPSVALSNTVTSLSENTATTSRIKVADLTTAASQVSTINVYGNYGTVATSIFSATVGYVNSVQNNTLVAQGFTTGTGQWDIKQVDVALAASGGNATDSRVYLFGDNYGVPGSLLSTYSLVNGPVTNSKQTFVFTGSYVASPSTNYWLVVGDTNSQSQQSSFEWYLEDTGANPSQRNSSGFSYLGTKVQNFIGANWTDTHSGLSIRVTSATALSVGAVLSGTDAASFEIDGNALYLKAGAALDYETKTTYAVTVSVPQGNSVPYTLTVTNVNEAPTNVALSASTVAENQPAGTSVGTLSTSDQDSGETFTYTLVTGAGDTDNASFVIEGDTLKTAAIFDYETKSSYTIRVRTTDGGGLFTEQSFAITISDTSDALGLSTSVVAENAALGSVVATITRNEILPDLTPLAVYYVPSSGQMVLVNTTAESLAIQSVQILSPVAKMSGATASLPAGASFTTANTADGIYGIGTEIFFASLGTAALTLAGGGAWDFGFVADVGLTRDQILSSFVTDPEVDVLPGSSAGQFLYSLVGGENVRGLISFGFRTYTYSLVPGLGDTDNAIFSIEGTSLKVAGAIDYEAKSHYTIRVRSTAQDGTWIEEVLSVDATDVNEAPTVVSLGNVTSGLDENTATSSRIKLADVTVTDDALGTNTLSLSGADASSFEIVGTSLYLKAGVTLDYETKPSYAVTVQASDATLPGSMPASQSYTLSVANVNEAPTGLGAFPTSVAENQPVGTTIGTLTTADPDSGDTFTYVLVSGAGDTDNGSFEIVGNALKAKASFNYEAKSSYTVRVRTTDAGGLFTEQQLTVTVTDVNESPTAVNLTNATASLAENTSTSSRIKLADIVVTDDAIGTNILSLSGADASSFEIVGTALYLKSGEGLDFETKVFYAVTVSVADSGLVGPASVRTDYTLGVTNVNEAPTNVALSPSTVAENQAEGASVGTLSSTDEDSGDTFSYTLVPGTGDMDNGSFEIVGGVLKTRAVFDYETKSSYTIRVRTTDTGGLFTEKQLTVTVTDVHDAPTNIALSASSIAENQPAGTTVGSLSTTDQDSVSGFTYSLVTGTGDTDNSSFEIVGGTLKTRAALNYESQSSYTFRVRTTDADGLFTEKQFTIGVTDVNEAPTAVRLVNAFPSIAENTSMVARVKVADIVITDDALGTNTVSLLGTDKSFFELDGLSLYLKAGTALDYGVKTSYDVTVDAADASAVDVVATTPLTVSYGVASGSLMLRNTTAGSLAVESVSILSPTHALSGVAAAPPPAAFTTLNTSDQGLYGRYSEIFFGNVGSAALTLAAGGTWNLGNVAQTGLTSSGITSAFGTDADADPEGRSAAGQFLYSTPDASGMLRGAIVCDISAAFTLRVQNVPEYSGREYAEVAAGQTVVDTTVRTGNRQVIVRGGGTLILAGASTNTGGVKVEGGALVVRNAAALGTGTLDVRAGGVVNLDVGYAKATVGGLTLESGARINLGTGGLQIAAGGTTLDALRSAILLARNGGAWNGTSGIGSASVDVSKSKVVGYRQMPSGAYQVAWAGYGDSNLDGRVNSTDINALNTARKFGLPARDSHWSQGDFTYDGRVSSTDIQLLSAMFGRPSYYASSTAPAAPVSQGNLPAATITAQLFASLGWVDPDGDGKP